jgi:hypothetical protein
MMQPDLFDGEFNPLKEARDKFFNALPDGGSMCPCCDRMGRLNKYTLNSSMVAALLWMSRTVTLDDGWVKMGKKAPAWILASKAFSTMKFWGFVEPAPKMDIFERNAIGMKTKTSGHWRVTAKGYEFLKGQLQVPSAAIVYNDELFGWVDESVNFFQAISKQFDYNEMMSINYNWYQEPRRIDGRDD